MIDLIAEPFGVIPGSCVFYPMKGGRMFKAVQKATQKNESSGSASSSSSSGPSTVSKIGEGLSFDEFHEASESAQGKSLSASLSQYPVRLHQVFSTAVSTASLSIVRFQVEILPMIQSVDMRIHVVPFLNRYHHVSSLTIAHYGIGDTGISDLAKVPTITHLSVRNTEITDASAAIFLQFHGLISLDVSYNELTGKWIETIATHPTLKSLTFQGEKICEIDFKALANSRLSSLDLSEAEISSEGLQQILTASTTLTALRLESCKLEEGHIEALATSQVLKELYLRKNLIDDEKALILSHNRSLELLNLDLNQVCTPGFSAIIENIPTLTNVSLRYNSIGNQALINFSKTKIASLDVTGNLLGAVGVVSLTQSPCLQYLAIGANGIGTDGVELLSKVGSIRKKEAEDLRFSFYSGLNPRCGEKSPLLVFSRHPLFDSNLVKSIFEFLPKPVAFRHTFSTRALRSFE